MSAPRSLLFVPADDRDRLAVALASDADAVCADLEDSVPEARKRAARDVVADLLGTPRAGGLVYVRVNVADGPFLADDLALVAELEVDAIVLPKATPDALASLGPDGPPLVAVVETALGLRLAYESASLPRVQALALGAKDLALDLGLERREDAQELLYARSKLVVDAVAGGVRATFDRVLPPGSGSVAPAADAAFARALGFTGKSTLTLEDVEAINRAFARDRSPSAG